MCIYIYIYTYTNIFTYLYNLKYIEYEHASLELGARAVCLESFASCVLTQTYMYIHTLM